MGDNASSDSVVELLNDASMSIEPSEKLDCLRRVQEIIIHRVRFLTKRVKN